MMGFVQDGCFWLYLMLQNIADTLRNREQLWYRWCAATKNVGKGTAPPMTNFGSMVRDWVRRLESAEVGAWSWIC